MPAPEKLIIPASIKQEFSGVYVKKRGKEDWKIVELSLVPESESQLQLASIRVSNGANITELLLVPSLFTGSVKWEPYVEEEVVSFEEFKTVLKEKSKTANLSQASHGTIWVSFQYSREQFVLFKHYTDEQDVGRYLVAGAYFKPDPGLKFSFSQVVLRNRSAIPRDYPPEVQRVLDAEPGSKLPIHVSVTTEDLKNRIEDKSWGWGKETGRRGQVYKIKSLSYVAGMTWLRQLVLKSTKAAKGRGQYIMKGTF